MKSLFSKNAWIVFFVLYQYPGLRTSAAMKSVIGRPCTSFTPTLRYSITCLTLFAAFVLSLLVLIINAATIPAGEMIGNRVFIHWISLIAAIISFNFLVLCMQELDDHLFELETTWYSWEYRRMWSIN